MKYRKKRGKNAKLSCGYLILIINKLLCKFGKNRENPGWWKQVIKTFTTQLVLCLLKEKLRPFLSKIRKNINKYLTKFSSGYYL